MTFIEELTQEFVSMYTSKNEKEIIHKARFLVREINRNEFQFMMTKHPYAVARALYYLLSDEAKLTDEESVPVAKLLYYCLLKNYLTNSNADVSDANFSDLIGGCQLGVIFMTKYIKFVAFLLYRVLLIICQMLHESMQVISFYFSVKLFVRQK